VASDGLVGLLSLQAGDHPDRLGPRPEQALGEIASAAAAEVSNAAREARLAARATRITAMNELALRLLRESEPNEVVRLASGSIAMILECDHVILRLRDDTTGRFVIRSYYGPADARQQEKLFRLDQRISAEVVKTRAACRHPDVEKDDVNRSIAAGVRSSLAVPLKREGRVVGTIALYDKAPSDRFHSTVFSEEDVELFGQFASYVERGLAHAAVQSWARQHPGRDTETDLPSDDYLKQRLDQELARSTARGGSLVVGTCRIENFRELGRPEQGTRVIQRLAEALGRRLRPFDVLARSGESELRFLLPEPEPDPGAKVSQLARQVAEEISGDESLNAPVRIGLAFGYAAWPDDADEPAALLRKSAAPRIRMV